MRLLNDLVVVKNEKNEMVSTEVYQRVYLAYGPNDAIEEKAVTAGSKSVGTKQVPKESKSVHDPNELFTEAIAWLQKEKPKSDPLIVLLGEAEYGLDLAARASIRNRIAPSKPIDEDKTVEKAAKMLLALGLHKDLATAKDAVRAQLAAQKAAEETVTA